MLEPLSVSVPPPTVTGVNPNNGPLGGGNPVTVTGTVLELQFENPHSFIIFEVKDASGKAERWQAELGGAGQLRRADGWSKDTLKPGDKITIIGPRAKSGAPDMNLSHESRIVMTDTGKEIHNSMKKGTTDN